MERPSEDLPLQRKRIVAVPPPAGAASATAATTRRSFQWCTLTQVVAKSKENLRGQGTGSGERGDIAGPAMRSIAAVPHKFEVETCWVPAGWRTETTCARFAERWWRQSALLGKPAVAPEPTIV